MTSKSDTFVRNLSDYCSYEGDWGHFPEEHMIPAFENPCLETFTAAMEALRNDWFKEPDNPDLLSLEEDFAAAKAEIEAAENAPGL